MTDEQMIGGLFQREESALAALQCKYRQYVSAIARKITGSHEAAEEVCGDVWLRIWQSIPPNRPENLRLYIARLARTRSLTVLESENTQKRSAVCVQLDELGECLPDTLSHVEPEQLALRQLMADFVRSLPREKRLIFVRRYWYGDTVEELAQRIGCKPARITGILYRTRQSLRKLLEQEGIDL